MSAAVPEGSRAGRPVRLGDTPTLSVVVASRGELRTLRALLGEILPPCLAHEVEVLVVRAGPPEETAVLAREHPGVRFLPPPAGAAGGGLRSAGLAAADGDVVMVTDDDDPDAPARLAHLLRGRVPLRPAQTGADREAGGLAERAG